MRILYTTDWHLRDTCPENRVDDYVDLQFRKLIEIKTIFEEEKCDYLFFGGDLFDKWNSSLELTNRVLYFLKNDFNIQINGIIGNHDILGYNLDTIKQSSLGILLNAGVFSSFSNNDSILDINTRKTGIKETYFQNKSLIISHDMIVPEPVIFEHLLCSDLDGCAKIVLCGHYHKPFYLNTGKTRFVNPGALMRMSIDDKWHPQVAIIEINTPNIENIFVKFIQLLGVNSYSEVFNNNIVKKSSIEIPKFDIEKIGAMSLVDKIKIAGKDFNECGEVIDYAVDKVHKEINKC